MIKKVVMNVVKQNRKSNGVNSFTLNFHRVLFQQCHRMVDMKPET
jgi:hypothetical protein